MRPLAGESKFLIHAGKCAKTAPSLDATYYHPGSNIYYVHQLLLTFDELERSSLLFVEC